MPQHETRNTCYWITSEVKSSDETWPVYILQKKSFYQKICKKCYLDIFCVHNELNETSVGKWNCWNKVIILSMQYQNH